MKRFIYIIFFLSMHATCMADRSLLIQQKPTKYALVIGNNSYRSIEPLKLAVNDAHAIGKTLSRIGFKVFPAYNMSKRELNKTINKFLNEATGAEIALIFYAGHGIQAKGLNYILPTDIEKPNNDADLIDQSISLQQLQEKVGVANVKLGLFIVDACRDNPITTGGRSIQSTRGLASQTAVSGQIIIFSAGSNQKALERLSESDANENSVFTRELLPIIEKPGISVSEILKNVRANVIKASKSVNHEQNPAIYDESDGEYYLTPLANASIPNDQASLEKILSEIRKLQEAGQKPEVKAYTLPFISQEKNTERLELAAPTSPTGSSFTYRITDKLWHRSPRIYNTIASGAGTPIAPFKIDGTEIRVSERHKPPYLIFGDFNNLVHFDISHGYFDKYNITEGAIISNLKTIPVRGISSEIGWGFWVNMSSGSKTRIETKAGTFQCEKMVFQGTNLGSNISEQPSKVTIEMYYSREHGRMIKQDIKLFLSNGGLIDHAEYELIELS